MPMRFVAKTRMSERFREQKRITKLVADAFFERIHRSESKPPRRVFQCQ